VTRKLVHVELADLTAATFAPYVGDTFALAAEPQAVELVLAEVTTLADRPGGRDPFSLLFRGPPQPNLPQAIHRLEHAQLGALEIFVVPLAPDDAGTRYEAIFS
jgi:hypothetical protein